MRNYLSLDNLPKKEEDLAKTPNKAGSLAKPNFPQLLGKLVG